MKKYIAIIIIFLPVFLNASDYLTPKNIATISNIISDTVFQRYESALARCDSLQMEKPENPMGYFFHAATLQSQMMDYEKYDAIGEFFKYTQKAIKLSKADIKKYPDNSWPHFFLGGAIGYEAMVRGRNNELFHAFKDGWKSINALQTALKIDSTNYDIYLGIGTYKYYRSQLSKYLKWLPFIADERSAGKEMIRQAIEKGQFTRPAAINGLFWILVKEDKFDEAEQLINVAVTEHPGSRFFLWGKAKINLKQEKWQEAIRSYQQILATYRTENIQSNFNEMQIYTSLAEIYFNLTDFTSAIKFARMAMEMEIDPYLERRAKPIKKRAKEFLKKSEKQSS
ncbi:MAG: tetratricopeptide repeat protein [Calditrichaeota bacterium]|nr:MAG: tetratricopeptide repeat protein [Calditrichota bacterium]